MQTVADNLQEMAAEIENLLEKLLLNQSSIYQRFVTNDRSPTVIGLNLYAYQDLGEKGRQIQGKLLERYRRFYSLLATLLSEQPKDTLQTLSRLDKKLTETIEQQPTDHKTVQEALEEAKRLLIGQVALLKRLYDVSAGEPVYVLDTSALIHNPNLEKWAFADTPRFTLVLLPTVLAELDSLKTEHHNRDVRDKAKKIIRMMKEYSRRGSLADGVPLVKGRSSVVAIAVDPDMSTTLPWLHSDVPDDRILANTIEIMRSRPRTPVVLITADFNLQNKASFARIPALDPPDPAQ